MNEISQSNQMIVDEIKAQILVINGNRYILDNTLAKLYDIETKTLKRAVKRNIDRFPSDFMVELSPDDILRYQMAPQVGEAQDIIPSPLQKKVLLCFLVFCAHLLLFR